MARSNESFNRRERERAKKQKADAKRQRRLTRPESGEGEGDEATDGSDAQPVDQGALLQRLAELNEAFEAGDLTFEDFDEQRAELIALIAVD